jgi:hopene-associated glycosyltransferase HpnB
VTAIGLSLLMLEAAALVAWLVVLLGHARAWDLRPLAEDEPPPALPRAWPEVHVLVPAHDEGAMLPLTLPALLRQDYPGRWRLILVDDRSTDGTAAVALELGGVDARLTVLRGAPLPAGWIGKVWALEQAARESARDGASPRYLLLTDADILHAPGTLRRLVSESEASDLALNSRMARLRCVSGPERLLIPPFVFFFNLLFPMRRVNDTASPVAAAAGGCVLLRRDALEQAGGFPAISAEVIDDVNLAHRVKLLGRPIRLSLSRSAVTSVRVYGSVAAVWRMVRRSAFDQLHYSWVLLAATLVALAALFVVPPLGVALGAVALARDASPLWSAQAVLGLAAWSASTLAYSRSVRYFDLPRVWSLTLPLAGILYGGMTIDSALRTRRGIPRW